MVLCASIRHQDHTQCGETAKGKETAESYNPESPSQPLCAPGAALNSFPPPSLGPGPPRRPPRRSARGHGRRFLLSRCHLASAASITPRIASVSPSPRACLVFCLWVLRSAPASGLAPSLPPPRPFPRSSNPGSAGLALHAPIGWSGAPSRPAHPVPLRALHSHKVWLPSCGGRGRPGPAQLCPQRPDPGPGPQTSPYLIPAPV